MPAAVAETLYNVNKDAADDFIQGKTFRVMLCTGEIDGSIHDNISDLTEISAGNGYSAGGPSTTVTANQSGADAYFVATQPTITASGGDIGPYTGIAIYEVATGKLRGAWNEVTPVTIANGSSKTLQFNQAEGFMRWGRVEP